MKFGSKKAIFGAIWGGFEGFGPCLGVSHPTHPYLGEISQKKTVFFLAASLKDFSGRGGEQSGHLDFFLEILGQSGYSTFSENIYLLADTKNF